MRPPFTLTSKIVNYVGEISLLLGRYEGLQAPIPQPQLRRQTRIRTIQGSLAIEGNTLDLEQITALFGSKRIIGPRKDILEVQNAIRVYASMRELIPTKIDDFLKAHALLMRGLDLGAGKFRTGAVGVLKGSKVSHLAPPAKLVPKLIENLFQFLKTEKELSPLIRACVFHYELEFIHPFLDGNGRMGRLWQTIILASYHPAFEFIPVESLIKERQKAYYSALEVSDKRGESTAFIEFSLQTIRDALCEFLEQLRPVIETPKSRLLLARNRFKEMLFTRKDYLKLLKNISTATASRDLALGVSCGDLEKSGTKAVTQYRFTSS